MRLLHVSNYHSPYGGSFVPMLRAALRLGLERGLRAEAVFLEGPAQRPWLAELEADGIPVRFVPLGGLGDLLAEDPGPTILHVHFSVFGIEAARAARRHPETTLYWHVHTTLRRGALPWVRNAVRFRLLSRPVREILCVAPDLADDVRHRLGPRTKVVFFPNAVDLARFRPAAPEERLAARERLGLPAGVPVLLHMGRDWRGKGGDLYAEAVRRLGPDRVVAVSVGAGEEAVEPVRALEPTDRVQDLYAAADVFVSPSRAEGMPFSLVEALASGTAVAASDIPGQRYVGEHVDACRLVPLDAGELAAAIDSLLARDAARAAADAAQARAWLEQHMDVRVWAERLFERYAQAGALPT